MSTIYNPKSTKAEEFISHEEILETLAFADEHKNDRAYIESILEKAKPVYDEKGRVHCDGLSHREASVLLACELPDLNEKMFKLFFIVIQLSEKKLINLLN